VQFGKQIEEWSENLRENDDEQIKEVFDDGKTLR